MGKNRKHHSYLLRYSSRDSIHSSTEFHDQSIINSAALVEGRWAPFPESAPKKICFIMDEGKRRPWPTWCRIARVVDAGWFKPPLQMVVILDRRWFVDCSGFAKDCWFCIFFSWFSDLPEIAWYIMVPYSIRFPSVFLLKWPFSEDIPGPPAQRQEGIPQPQVFFSESSFISCKNTSRIIGY